jgi:hypothetical protein
MLDNVGEVKVLQWRRKFRQDYGIREALYLALLTGEPVPHPEAPGAMIGEYQHDENGEPVYDWATCGACGLTWNDALITSITPAPSARCPFEDLHEDEDEDA